MPDTTVVIRVIHDTLMVHDTTVVRDTLDHVVTPVGVSLLQGAPRDWLDYVQIGASVLVAPLFAVLAAKVGAIEGGKVSREASLAAIREEYDVERRHAMRRLRDRVTVALPKLRGLANRAVSVNVKEPFVHSIAEELEVAWNLYYRVMEPVFTLTPGDLAGAIDELFGRAHVIAEDIKTLEAHYRAIDPTSSDTLNGEPPMTTPR